MWFIVIIQINSKVALCGGVKEITGKWEYSLGFWQLYTNCPQQKNLMKSPDERLFRQEVAEDWRVSFSSDEEEASWFHFLFSFCFDILASCLRIQQYSFLWRPPLRSFSPPHHTLLIIIIVVGYRVWQTSKGRLWSLERLASRGHHGGPRRTLHSTEQLSSVSGRREWVGARRLQMTLLVFSSELLTPLLAWYWWMAVAFIRVVWFWSECSLCFHIYCNVTSRQRLYLKLREEGWKLFCRCIWDQTGLKTHNKY